MNRATTFVSREELANAKCAIFAESPWVRWCAETALYHAAADSEGAAWLHKMVKEIRQYPESWRAARYAAKLP